MIGIRPQYCTECTLHSHSVPTLTGKKNNVADVANSEEEVVFFNTDDLCCPAAKDTKLAS